MTTALEEAEWSAGRPGLLYTGKDSLPIVQEAGWAPVPVWTGGKSRHTGIRSLDHPRSGGKTEKVFPILSLLKSQGGKNKMLGHREVFNGHDVEVQYLDFRSRIFGIFRCFSQRY